MFGRLTKKQQQTAKVNEGAAPRNRKDMVPSVIASNMHVLGNIVSEGILDIDGQVEGNVRGHTITIRPNGRIRGDVMAEEVFVHGTVEGLIKATSVVLYASALVTGTVMHESLTVEDGAAVDGKIKRTERMVLEDKREEPRMPVMPPIIDSSFVNDNDEPPQTEKEIRILENLRLIS